MYNRIAPELERAMAILATRYWKIKTEPILRKVGLRSCRLGNNLTQNGCKLRPILPCPLSLARLGASWGAMSRLFTKFVPTEDGDNNSETKRRSFPSERYRKQILVFDNSLTRSSSFFCFEILIPTLGGDVFCFPVFYLFVWEVQSRTRKFYVPGCLFGFAAEFVFL